MFDGIFNISSVLLFVFAQESNVYFFLTVFQSIRDFAHSSFQMALSKVLPLYMRLVFRFTVLIIHPNDQQQWHSKVFFGRALVQKFGSGP